MLKASVVSFWILLTIWVCGLASVSAQSPEDGAGQPASTSGEQGLPEAHWEEGRVKVKLATLDMAIAQANKIPLDLHGFSASRITADWSFSNPLIESQVIAQPEELPLQHAEDGSPYVNFVPIRLGKLQLRILVAFKDGNFSSDSVEVNVDRLPDQAPSRLILSDPKVRIDFTRKAGTLHLDLSPGSNDELLVPVAFYSGITSPIPLNPIPSTILDDIAFTVIPRRNQPSPIAFNPSTGEVKAVRIGQALVRATLRGKSAYACVDVMKDVREFNERSNCSDFLPPGLTEPIDEPMQEPKRAGP